MEIAASPQVLLLGFPTCTVGIIVPEWNLPPWLLLSPCNSEKLLAPCSLYLPRQQLSMSQLFPMLHFPGCTTLDLTDPPLSLCVPPSSPHPHTVRRSPRAAKGRKDHFHHHAGAQEHSQGHGCPQENTTTTNLWNTYIGPCSHMQNLRDQPTAPSRLSHFAQATE